VLRVWYWLLWLGAVIALDLRLYYLWSRLGRWLYERQFLGREIRRYDSAQELQKAMEPWVWRPDPFWQFGDMISCPAAVEYKGTLGEPVGDCDDFSVYAGEALRQLNDAFGSIDGKVVREISLLTVPWMEPTGKPNGHNVCVFRYLTPGKGWAWAWVSNWYDTHIQWSHPSGAPYEGPGEIAAFMCEQFEAQNTRWARVSLDLKKVYETGTAS
jgi:hypothetical protein